MGDFNIDLFESACDCVSQFIEQLFTDIPTLLICSGVSRKLERSPCLRIFVKFSVFLEIFEKHAVCYDC